MERMKWMWSSATADRGASWLGYAVFASLAFAGCGDDDGLTVDMGDGGGRDMRIDGDVIPDGGDPCEGVTLCAAAGAQCDGNELVRCANNAAGCLVETRTSCIANGGTCDDSGATAVCTGADPCANIPVDQQCTGVSRTCEDDTLVECAANAAGCMVLTRTDCAAGGGTCDDEGTAMCSMPPDPCDLIPAGERCAAEGTSCNGDVLFTCAPNAMGCLVLTEDDCMARGGVCEQNGATAMCSVADPCAGVMQCAAAGSSCNMNELVTCAPDAAGCLVETRTDCAAAMGGFCDPMATPAPVCVTDPCAGMTQCAMADRVCNGDTLTVCAMNAMGCLVETTTDCTTNGNVCGDDAGMAQCGPVCSFRNTCPSAAFCDMDDFVSCTADADGCLIEDTRTTCSMGQRCTSSGCATGNACPSAAPTVLDCTSGTVMGDTANGSMLFDEYTPCTFFPGAYAFGEQLFVFQNPAGPAEVSITSTRGAGVGDYDLFVLDGGDGTAMCGAADTCIDSSAGVSATETVAFDAAPTNTYYVVYDLFEDLTPETTDFTLEVTCTPIVCGDGTVSGTEECDDGDLMSGDGCSATCTVEPGFACTGSPSVCQMAAANSTCAMATAITGDRVITGENTAVGGPRPAGMSCGSGSGTSALYYSVTIPAMTAVTVLTTTPAGAFNRVLVTQDSCAAVDCSSRVDSTPERATLTNTTGAPVTRIVAIHSATAGSDGAFDIEFQYHSPVSTLAAMCADLSGATGLGVLTDDSASTIMALPFTLDYFGAMATHFSATSNGFAQLWTSDMGTPSTSFGNLDLPDTSTTRNGIVAPFWDDLRPNMGADVYTMVMGAAPMRTFVIEWRNWRATSSGMEDLTFQAHFIEATGNIEFHYCALNADPAGTEAHTGLGATIGVESIDGLEGYSFSHNTAGAVMSGSGFSTNP